AARQGLFSPVVAAAERLETSSDRSCSLGAARTVARPIVQVNQLQASLLRGDTVPSIHLEPDRLRSRLGNHAQLVPNLGDDFALRAARRETGQKPPPNPVELDRGALDVTLNDCAPDPTRVKAYHGIGGRVGAAHEHHVIDMGCVDVTSLDPPAV